MLLESEYDKSTHHTEKKITQTNWQTLVREYGMKSHSTMTMVEMNLGLE